LRSILIDEKQIKDSFASIGQGEIFRFWGELNQAERSLFLQQLEKIDPSECQRAWKEINVSQRDSIDPQPPEAIKATKPQDSELIRMHEHGEEILANGKVAAFTVAGGQGTRLGHNGPKGTFPCTPLTKHSLFQHFAESLLFYNKRLGVTPRWFIMTSLENHYQTILYFEKNHFFGLDKNRVTFFQQGMMPAFDIDGKMLLKEKHKLEMSPNGHGGSLKALVDSGSIDLMEEEEIDCISYFQVDNPMVYCIDPTFLGFHQVTGSEMSSKAVEKLSSNERVGTFVQNEKSLHCLEYSDIPKEISSQKKKDGSLIFALGSIAIHILDRNFVRRITSSENEATQRLKYHGAHKKVSYLDDNGILIRPETPNAIKAETFVFDALPLARNPLLMEINREDEFGPIKNPTGTDSLVSSEKLQISRNLRWLHELGQQHTLTNLEISPLFAPTLPYLSKRISKLPLDLKKYTSEPVLLGEDGRALEII
jgi:UDP-N-acetylglucosamine/UDP-N-acetylgalactosamine diphosphorylase